VKSAGLKVIRMEKLMQMVAGLEGQYLPDREGYDPKVPWAQPDKAKALKVRQALSLAINRQEIVNKVLQGMGTVDGSAGIQAFPGMPGFDPSLKVDPYDPERAKKLLAEAGYPIRRRSASSSTRLRTRRVPPTRPWRRRSRCIGATSAST
jgi:peptide/nickel transport system substrate-binding protein